jgi:8-oxo-dGTP diphosphatase
MSTLKEQIEAVLDLSICNKGVCSYWLKRLENSELTRDENPISHFCCYFLPYNSANQQVFIVHHKKSGLWLAPGGHIDKGEELMQTLNREIKEELGVKNKIKDKIKPFLLTITPISNPVQPCKEHLDIWYRFPTNGSEFNVDPREFHETRWVTIDEAKKIVTDPPNIEALNKIEKLFDNQN